MAVAAVVGLQKIRDVHLSDSVYRWCFDAHNGE
jgi:hypothetical protein